MDLPARRGLLGDPQPPGIEPFERLLDRLAARAAGRRPQRLAGLPGGIDGRRQDRRRSWLFRVG